jgi:hypothetical protein
MKKKNITKLLVFVGFLTISKAQGQQQHPNDIGFIDYTPNKLISPFMVEDKECPPCFNCMLPGFECLHFANCSEYDGKCNCPPGFGGNDCKQPRKSRSRLLQFHI